MYFGESFYHEQMLNFIKSSFLCDYQDGYVVFIVIVVYYPDWHAYIEWSLGLWNEFDLLIVYDPFSV